MPQNFEVPTWNQIYTISLNVAGKIRSSGYKMDTIIAISRGGWLPARILADLLGSSDLADVKTEFYAGIAETKAEPVLSRSVTADVADRRILVVDEVADTGRSLNLVKNHIAHIGASEVRAATLYHKPCTLPKPDYSEKETSRWVVFPWEIRETVQKILRKCAQSGSPAQPQIKSLIEAGVPSRLAARFTKEIIEEDRLAETH